MGSVMNLPEKLDRIARKITAQGRRLSAYQALAALDRKDIRKNRQGIDELRLLMLALSCMVLALCVLTFIMAVLNVR
jgi:hypothetical protein